jgi:hypothetical protein
VCSFSWGKPPEDGNLTHLFFPEVHVDQTELCRIANQFYSAVEVKLVHNAGPMVLNGFKADEKLFGDLFVGEPFDQHSLGVRPPYAE